jgi:methionyl-tRNA synthetase
VPPLAETVSLGAFSPIDLRVGRVAACEAVEGAKKLLRLTIDLGPLGTRNVFSGIAASYEPAALVGKHVVVFANLESRKMRFGISEGMVLASGESDDAVTVLELDRTRSRPGEKIS